MDGFHIGGRNINKDVRRRRQVVNAEETTRVLKALTRNKKTTRETKWRLALRGQRPQQGRITQIQNTCVFTTQTRSVYRRYRLARSTLKAMANKGGLAGVRKSSF